MPFLAIALKKNKLAYIDEFCTNPEIQGIEGYCNLISAYKILTTSFASNSDIKKSIQFIESAVNYGVLEEKVYGWWFFDDVTSNAIGFLPNGIPLSADVIYYISNKEAFELLEILKKGQNL